MENRRYYYNELVELHKQGKLEIPTDGLLLYHISKERMKLGDKYLITDTLDNFLKGINANKQLEKEIEKEHFKLIWGDGK